MVRTYQKKSDKQPTTPRKIKEAIKAVNDGWSIRQAAAHHQLGRETLRAAIKKAKEAPVPLELLDLKLTFKSRNVFPESLDNEIADYCILMAQTGYGLTVSAARDLAFEVADKNRDKLKIPLNWDRDRKAGIDWFHGFQKRHPNISIRVPEGCSVARAMAFNETNVKIFFDKLAEVRQRHPSFIEGSRVYNLDETNTSTVQNARKLLSPKGVKQVHQIKGAERGESVTTCVIIGAFGTILPPVHIFPRKKFNPDFMINAYPGAVGLANAKGYMTKETFVQVIEHFLKCTGSSLENPTLLLLDNVETHFSTETLNLAKNNGVTIFTFPPHCTHRMQPLDVGFFGPFKTFYDQAVNTYLANNPACPPTIYRVAGFVKDDLCKAATPHNIIKCFETTGIVPYNRHIFSEQDFMMASVTARPDPSTDAPHLNQQETEADINGNTVSDLNEEEELETQELPSLTAAINPGTPNLNETASVENVSVSGEETSLIGPMLIRGLPKAKPSKTARKPRRKGKCMVATDTPEKEEIRLREETQKQKKDKSEDLKRKREEGQRSKKGSKGSKIQTKKVKRNLQMDLESDNSEEADDVNTVPPTADCVRSFPPLEKDPEEGDFVLVSFQAGKESVVYFVGKILSEADNEGDLEISYYRKKISKDKTVSFYLPNIPDLKSVNISDVMLVLPKPQSTSATRRQQSFAVFNFDFSNVKLG